MNEQQPNEVHAATAEAVRSAIMVAMQAAELVAMRRADQARAAQAASDQERAAYSARLAAEREAVKPVLRRAWDDRWWPRASTEEIKDTWQITASWAGADPYAAATLAEMRRQIARRFGVKLPADAVRADEVATLLAAARTAEAARLAEKGAVGPEPEAGEEPPELFAAPREQSEFTYVVRESADPTRVLDSGTLALDPAASAQDAAIEGLRRYADLPGPVPSPAEQIEVLFAQGFGGAANGRDISGLEIAIFPAGQRDGQPLAVLSGPRLQQARDDQRAARREVIERRRPASPADILAALRMETQVSHDELVSLQDRLRQLAEAQHLDPAERELAAEPLRQASREARERLAQLRLERRIAEADARGEDGALIPRAELLREHLDEDWFHTATPRELAGVWDHVASWSPGEARAAAETHLRASLYRAHRLDPAHDATGAAIETALARRRDALRARSRDERAVARGARENAARLDADEADPARARAEQEHDASSTAAAAQDEAAAAALAAAEDQQAATAVALAAEGFTGTPSKRIAPRRSAAGRGAKILPKTRPQERGSGPDR